MSAIGIDLGTQCTKVAVFHNGKVKLIANDFGSRKTLSCVACTNTNCFIGEAAGNKKTQENLQQWTTRVRKDFGKSEIDPKIEFEGEQKGLTTAEVMSMVLIKVKEASEAYLGTSIKKAVIAVPANFNDTQRQLTKEAAAIAGLHVICLINEPKAIALAYAFGKKLEDECNIFVFDLGASSLDVSILTITESALLELKATASDSLLGAESFDTILMSHLADLFERENKIDLRSNLRAMKMLRIAAAKAKHDLSTNKKTVIKIEGLFEGLNFHTTVDRSEFEEICADRFGIILNLIEKALNVANMDKIQIHHIILAGSATCIPKLQNLLKTFFNGKRFEMSINPDEAIACGAALQVAILVDETDSKLQDLLFVDISKGQLVLEGNIGFNYNQVILACKHNKVKNLKYLFKNEKELAFLPESEDKSCHNAFYYAVRTGNVELLDILIDKWPGNYFMLHPEKLDEILSIAYEELKLRNVSLAEKMEIYVENKLINLRFFSNVNGQNKNIKKNVITNIKERIDFVLQSVNILKTEYSKSCEKEDERFIFILKFIAQNIHVLKRQLKSTYDSLPWEEIEFCLISFVSCYMKSQEIHLYYKVVLNKTKILNQLENFAKILEKEKSEVKIAENYKFSKLPKLGRDKVVGKILKTCPQFLELYADYQQIRDISSLEKVNDYIKLALSADPKEREGQLIITRVLQVIGEYLKNTLESPKLSTTTSELLLLSLPSNTRQIIIDLRNSLSHAHSLAKRIDIEEKKNITFFFDVQNDTKKIYNVITDILNKHKMKVIKMILNKIINSESADELSEIADILIELKLDQFTAENSEFIEHEKLEKLIKELKQNVNDQTHYEKELFHKIESILGFSKTNAKNIQINIAEYLMELRCLGISLKDDNMNNSDIKALKSSAKQKLENIRPSLESYNIKEIAMLARRIFHAVSSRVENDNLENINRITCEIFFIAEFDISDLKGIEELRDKLNEKGSFLDYINQKKMFSSTRENYNKQLKIKLAELESVFKKNGLGDKLTEKLPSYKTNKKLQAVVETLVLDIMSILDTSPKHLENNFLFLDDNTPLLTGKCLRNHLAHDNALVDVLLSDPSIAAILNAEKLLLENVVESKRKVGKLIRDDPLKVKSKFDQSLNTILNQQKMFNALQTGSFEDLEIYLEKGADIKARSIKKSNALHLAAQSANLELIKFLIDQKLDVRAKDFSGQNVLHIATAYGRENIVQYLIKDINLDIEERDNKMRTPLHIAAENGHKNCVETLLQNNANTRVKDLSGFSPLHYAVKNNDIDIAKILLKKENHVDSNMAMGAFTSLHTAAERGYLELVNFLLQNGANANAQNDMGAVPLHSAALNGHLEIVEALIQKGAKINIKSLTEYTPLLCAIEGGHEMVAKTLLKYGASVNVAGKACNSTPLHWAAANGFEEIVRELLNKKANVNIATIEGFTPLHVAAQNGRTGTVGILIEHGTSISAKDKKNKTPLHYATECGHDKIVELLIKNGAKVNCKADTNFTPLHLAAFKGHKHICELLLRHKAEINAQDIMGGTPLRAAAVNGSKDVIKLLLNNKAQVNAKSFDGMTPLHAAASRGYEEATAFLIQRKADINSRSKLGLTPLNGAVVGGHKNIVKLLLENNAHVDAKGIEDSTPLHIAVEGGYKEIVNILIQYKANVNAKRGKITPLLLAIKHNQKDIVKILLKNGADVNADRDSPLIMSVLAGYKDIVNMLLEHKARSNAKDLEGTTVLHFAAQRGHKDIARILIAKGADVNAKTIEGTTPLCCAAMAGHEDVAEILIANGADVNVATIDGSPIHIAAGQGHLSFVQVLLSKGAKAYDKDLENRTALELAVGRGHFEVVRLLLAYKKVDINAKGNDGYTLLHIASQESDLEIVKYLLEKGSNINAKNSSGSKPIHIAAREGFKGAVELFLSKGQSVNELGASNQTLLHYAAMKGQLEIVKYLIPKGADVNAKDMLGLTPMHIAAYFGSKKIIEVLLENGAAYNATGVQLKKPLECASNKDVVNLLTLIEKLFDSVKQNRLFEVEKTIKAGAFVNAKNSNFKTVLFVAAWKGYDKIVNLLLENKANANAADDKNFTALHYAAKFSHFKIAIALLSHGAVYNANSVNEKTPSDFATNQDIKHIFQLIKDSFAKVEEGNDDVISDLTKIQNTDTLKAVMNARNKDNETLIVAAMKSNFSKVQQLKEISTRDISAAFNSAWYMYSKGQYQKALIAFKSIFEERKAFLGPDSPATLEVQSYIAKMLSKQGSYRKALNMLEEIFEKQKNLLGLSDKETLSTRNTIALILHEQGNNEEAINIYREVYQKQSEILGPKHEDTLNTQLHMALVLDKLKNFDEAFNINKDIYLKNLEINGPNNSATVSAQNNMGLVLANQGKYDEALKIYDEVLKIKKEIYVENHPDTLRTLKNKACIFFNINKHDEALQAFQEVLSIQKTTLDLNHPDTLNTRYNIANIFFLQGKFISAAKAYEECFDEIEAVFGPNHPTTLDISVKLKLLDSQLKHLGRQAPLDIHMAASNSDMKALRNLLKDGTNVNTKDVEGRSPLHFAISNGHIDVVKFLLKNGADVTQATKKGNTPLHTATSKGNTAIVNLLLQSCPFYPQAGHEKTYNFVNAKTTLNATAPLHVAAKSGFYEIAKSLLENGAIYNIKNKEGNTPLYLCKDKKIIDLLKTVDKSFKEINMRCVQGLMTVSPDEIFAVLLARNDQGKNILEACPVSGKKKEQLKVLFESLNSTFRR